MWLPAIIFVALISLVLFRIDELCAHAPTSIAFPEETETSTTEEVPGTEPTAEPETTITACALPDCKFGYYICDSCTNCVCNPAPTATTPEPCEIECIPEPECTVDIDQNQCQCIYVCETTEPETTETAIAPTSTATWCEQTSDPFCDAVLVDGECFTVCCSLPFCEGGVDWEYCVSCSQCRCLPPPTETWPTEITDTTPCDTQCEYQPGCSVHVNSATCECEYNCTTIEPTRKPRRTKCWPLS